MPNLHDDNHLDDLSRRAAENFEPDGQLHSWEKLQPHLDRELPVKKERRRRYLFILLFFLLAGGGLIFSRMWNGNNDGAPAPVSQKATDKTSGAAPDKTSPTQDKTADKVVTPKTTGDASVPANTTKPPAADVVTGKPDEISTNIVRTTERNKRNTINKTTTNKRNTIADKQDKIPAITKADNPITKADNTSTNNDKADKENYTENKITTPPAAKDPLTGNKPQDVVTAAPKDDSSTSDKKQVITDEPVAEQKPADQIAKPNKKPANKSSVAASRWEFGALFAPDISTVKFTHTQKPGINAGLTIGYNFSRRFSLQTGALYTIKNYKSRGEDYHPPKGYWTDYVKLETVTADCNMWDIPLNLRYNIVPRQSSNLFATAGLSSYLMRKENYDYFYYYNNMPANRARSYETYENFWFSVLNLSFGYERQLNRNFSLQVEPFFKQPLKGVGFGSVKLNSTGVFFSLKYKPVATQKGK